MQDFSKSNNEILDYVKGVVYLQKCTMHIKIITNYYCNKHTIIRWLVIHLIMHWSTNKITAVEVSNGKQTLK